MIADKFDIGTDADSAKPVYYVYLAGPEVFLPEPVAAGTQKKARIAEMSRAGGWPFELAGLYPLDNEIPDFKPDFDTGLRIYRANVELMNRAYAVAANMVRFRGPSMDVGTAFEMGYMRGLGKPVFAYYEAAPFYGREEAPGMYVDRVRDHGFRSAHDARVDADGHSIDASKKEETVSEITTIGLDLAKHTFHVVGCDRHGKVLKRKVLRRRQVRTYFANVPACVVGMEGCASAHYWARELGELGHEVRLVPAQHVKAYVRGNKNDYNARVPSKRCSAPTCAGESEDGRAAGCAGDASDARARVKERTALCNQVRGLLGEYGIVVAQGVGALRRLVRRGAGRESVIFTPAESELRRCAISSRQSCRSRSPC